MSSSSDEPLYECRFCYFQSDDEEVRDHETYKHNYCDRCKRRFDNQNNLVMHKRVHRPRRLACWGGCNQRSFESYSGMLVHLESGNCSTTMTELDKYAARCFQSKKYIEPGYRGYLAGGVRIEQRTTPMTDWCRPGTYVCDTCDRAFSTLNGARLHCSSPVHDYPAYRCPTCDSRFNLLSGLVQHVESSHCDEEIAPGSPISKALHYIHLRLGYTSAAREDYGVLT